MWELVSAMIFLQQQSLDIEGCYASDSSLLGCNLGETYMPLWHFLGYPNSWENNPDKPNINIQDFGGQFEPFYEALQENSVVSSFAWFVNIKTPFEDPRYLELSEDVMQLDCSQVPHAPVPNGELNVESYDSTLLVSKMFFFSRRSDLSRHRRIHTGERPYHCEWKNYCKRLIQRFPLTVHYPTHTEEHPHVCEYNVCGISLSDSSSLAKHQCTHTGKRPYVYDHCAKSFTRKTILSRYQCCHDPEWKHSCHSFILDPWDQTWNDVFTEGDLNEIMTENAPEVLSLPAPLQRYMDKFSSATTLDQLQEVALANPFHALENLQLHWMEGSILKALDLLYYDIIHKYKSEVDLMKRVWCFIDWAFDVGDVDVIAGEYVIKSSSARINSSRTLSGVETLERKKTGAKVDLLFTTAINEMDTAENGKNTDMDTDTTKAAVEYGIRTSKGMQDIIYEMPVFWHLFVTHLSFYPWTFMTTPHNQNITIDNAEDHNYNEINETELVGTFWTAYK
ncbi:hypothetical protein INT45_001357, partial [Circinella minor]